MAGSGYIWDSAGRRSIPAFSKELTKPLGLWEQRACSTWHVVRTYRIVKANMAKGKFEISTTVGSNPPPHHFNTHFPYFSWTHNSKSQQTRNNVFQIQWNLEYVREVLLGEMAHVWPPRGALWQRGWSFARMADTCALHVFFTLFSVRRLLNLANSTETVNSLYYDDSRNEYDAL